MALVSDAGTPGLNDPGYELVRAALQAGFAVSPVPGPSAPLAALVASGLPSDSFLYLGYLPRRSGERRSLLEEVQDRPHTLVFLETPHRLQAALDDLLEVLGDRQSAVARADQAARRDPPRPIERTGRLFRGQPAAASSRW